MSPKSIAESLGMRHPDLVNIFYEEAKRISPDEKEALSLTREAVKQFLDHSNKTRTSSNS